ncbi:MAG TPA: DUF4956 domain-containing protein [Candidatus Alectryocaccobium stercorigallinarum]|nr:DUF4956 domain-containing protein [Candidatus Alectryocaccobium stercorigallinarum]
MSFQDIFKSDFLDNIAGISLLDMVIALVLAFLIGLFIFFIYKKSCSGVMYSASFGVTLIALALITTLLIMTVVSNIVLSLGMVGALSIVRFRTAIKEPMDIAFLFWSIAAGIVLAAGLIPLAVFGSIFIGVVLLVFAKKKTVDSPYILIVHCENSETEERTRIFIASQVVRINLKSKSVDEGRVELNYEVRLKDDDSAFVNELENMDGVSRVVLVSYNGDYMG